MLDINLSQYPYQNMAFKVPRVISEEREYVLTEEQNSN
jgi:hypothetical protein